MKVKSESEVAQSCPTLRDSMGCSLPGSSVHGIFQARVLVWGAIAFSNFFDYTPVKVNFEKKQNEIPLDICYNDLTNKLDKTKCW